MQVQCVKIYLTKNITVMLILLFILFSLKRTNKQKVPSPGTAADTKSFFRVIVASKLTLSLRDLQTS